MFQSSSPKARTIKISAFIGCVVGVFLAALVSGWVIASGELSGGNTAYNVGVVIGVVFQVAFAGAVFAGIVALVGLAIAAVRRLPGKNEIAFGPQQPQPPAFQPQVSAGWYPDPAGQPQLRYWDGGQWTEHTAPAGNGA
ncbi:DUF2510 domain-containing protein [Gordonia iterans]|uniref:DUF2510 domain-containing protein n=1 Tax=Gordonia iterans TaxID=1004901 RepID=UPI0018FE17B5|nr:DUF2510 domain-containing protein [Gordonia iterans]